MLRGLLLASILIGCGGGQSSVEAPDGEDSNDEGAPSTSVPVTPQKEGPPALSDGEAAELAGKCAPIEPDLYEAGKAGIAALEAALLDKTPSEAAEDKGRQAALAYMEGKNGGMDSAGFGRCMELFGKQMKRRLFDFEPHEQEARMTVDSCVKRAVAAFGKQSTVIDMGGSGSSTAQGPFCPDDFPVPADLGDLPYKSKGEDWETPTWKCLQFGLRTLQNYQVEYAAPVGSSEFVCITRFLPRQGGAPVELLRGGKMNAEGELSVADKIQKRRMKE